MFIKSVKFLTTLLIISSSLIAGAQNLQAGKKAMEMEKYGEAKRIFSSLISQGNANEAELYYNLGEVYFLSENIDSAKYWFQKGTTATGNTAANFVGLGKIALYKDQPSEAKTHFETASKMVKDKDPLILSLISSAYLSTPNKYKEEAFSWANKAVATGKKSTDAYSALGDALHEKGESGPAISNYETAIEINKNIPALYVKIGTINNHARIFKDALPAFEKAMAIDPAYAPAYRELAETYFNQGQFEKARDTYKQYMDLTEVDIAKEIRYAQMIFVNKDYKNVTDRLNDILSRDSSNIYLYRLNAYTNYELGKYPEGIRSMDKFFSQVKPEKIMATDYEYYGKLLAKTPGKDSLGVTYLLKALEIDSTNTQLLADIAGIYSLAYKDSLAVVYYEKMMQKKENPAANDYFLLGKAYYFKKDYNRADSAFAKVIEIKPDVYLGYLWRAKTNYYLDPSSEKGLAKPFHEKYIEVVTADSLNLKKYTKDLSIAYEYLGFYHFLKNDKAKSLEYWQLLLALDPANKKAQEGIKNLKKP